MCKTCATGNEDMSNCDDCLKEVPTDTLVWIGDEIAICDECAAKAEAEYHTIREEMEEGYYGYDAGWY